MRNNFAATALAIATLLTSSSLFAQGTATGPSTEHLILPSATGTHNVFIGGLGDTINGPGPIPIDLDVDGPPWRKAFKTGPTTADIYAGSALILNETIQNVGTEPWTDWHEIDLQSGSHGTAWEAVTDVRINGTSITYDATISGTTIDLDNFSQPVLPGDIFQIRKVLLTLTDNVAGPDTVVARILEYPTTNIPEPTTALLLLCGSMLGLSIRRRNI